MPRREAQSDSVGAPKWSLVAVVLVVGAIIVVLIGWQQCSTEDLFEQALITDADNNSETERIPPPANETQVVLDHPKAEQVIHDASVSSRPVDSSEKTEQTTASICRMIEARDRDGESKLAKKRLYQLLVDIPARAPFPCPEMEPYRILDLLGQHASSLEIRHRFGKKRKEWRHRDYLIQLWVLRQGDDLFPYQWWFEVYQEGKLLLISDGAAKMEIGTAEQDKTWLQPGSDFTGDGVPNLAVISETAGRDCCATLQLFELGDTFRSINSTVFDEPAPRFEDFDEDGFPELLISDEAFEFWKAPRSHSIYPPVILKWNPQNMKFAFAADIMKRPAPTLETIEALAKKFTISAETLWANEWDDGDELLATTKLDLFGRMADWAYSGNMDAAVKLFRKAWPKNIPFRKEAFTDFKKQLRSSKYWKSIRDLHNP